MAYLALKGKGKSGAPKEGKGCGILALEDKKPLGEEPQASPPPPRQLFFKRLRRMSSGEARALDGAGEQPKTAAKSKLKR